jgi:hypothetical protein
LHSRFKVGKPENAGPDIPTSRLGSKNEMTRKATPGIVGEVSVKSLSTTMVDEGFTEQHHRSTRRLNVTKPPKTP